MSPPKTLLRCWRRLAKAESGIAATEFALLLPIMLVMWLGMVEVTQVIAADRKATLLTRTLADLTTQSTAVNDTDLDTIFNAARAVLAPFPEQRLSMRITSYDVDSTGQAFVDWSSVKTLTPAPPNAFANVARCTLDPDLPAALRTPSVPIVRAEVTLAHEPIFGIPRLPSAHSFSVVTDQINLADELFMRPRQGGKITKDGVPTAPCPGYVS